MFMNQPTIEIKIAPVKIILCSARNLLEGSTRGDRNQTGANALRPNSPELKKVRKRVFCQRM
jgi:hypothetical protein